MSAAATSKLGWYARRLGRMSPAEIAWRVREQALRRAWARRQVRPQQVAFTTPADGGTAGGQSASSSRGCLSVPRPWCLMTPRRLSSRTRAGC